MNIELRKILLSITRILPDKLYLQLMYYKHFKKFINFRNPRTFNEKLQWLKIYDKKDIYTTMVDKIKVKEYVSQIIGEEYIIPILKIWDGVENININELPPKFVIKCNHDSKSVIICKNKEKFDFLSAKKILSESLKTNGYWYGREWPYKNIIPKVFVEKYIPGEFDEELKDYKFYCFDGKVKLVMINSGRGTEYGTKADYFDKYYNYVDLTWGYEHAKESPKKPDNFDEMIFISEKLSRGLSHARIDLYNSNGKIYFGEITFFDASGFDPIEPIEWDYKLGEYIILPNKNSRSYNI